MLLIPIVLSLALSASAKQDCIPDQWENWSSCSQTCGAVGTRTRTRKIAILPTVDGVQCSSLDFLETEGCNRFCYNGGTIEFSACKCTQGFHGACCEVDVDECENANGGCQQKCINLEGSFRCECFDGFRENDQEICVDIDECDEKTSGCESLCSNYYGGYSCGCLPPKILEVDGRSCATENHCLTDEAISSCENGCVIYQNHFQCECPAGTQLDDETKQCLETDLCMQNAGFCSGGTCTSIKGEVYCDCGIGRGLGPDGEICIDVDECRAGISQCSHTCVNKNAGHVCLCPAGMIIGSDHKTCEDENECLRDPAPCSHSCTDLIGGFACSCPEHMELEHDNRTCCEIGKCIKPLSSTGKSDKSQTTIVTISVVAIVIIVVLVLVIWRMIKRNMNTSEKVLRAIKHGEVTSPDIYYNRNTETMELETRGVSMGAVAADSSQSQSFHRKNVKKYGAGTGRAVLVN